MKNFVGAIVVLCIACGTVAQPKPNRQVVLPPPHQTKSVRNYCKLIGWQKGQTPTAPAGFKVNEFAGGLDNPRNVYVAQNGDVFAAQATTEIKGVKKVGAKLVGAADSENIGKSPNNIILLRDNNGDGIADTKTVFLANLNQPFGMLIWHNYFYVANTDGLWRYPYQAGQTKITQPGKMILSLPAGGYNNHWTRNLRLSADGNHIYISVGSGSNDGDHGMANEKRRANILVINPDGTGEQVYASGLRNPTGIDIEPRTHVLWTAVNERDGLGDNLVPDYFTAVKQGGFYGWPYVYFGQHPDPDQKNGMPAIAKKSITPDVSLGAHTASLGLEFYKGDKFPAHYRDGAFIGQHGSWNRSVLSGYKVVFIPFANGRPAGKPEDFLTGFIADLKAKKVHGRPVELAVAKDGSLLVADDSGNKIWRVSAK